MGQMNVLSATKRGLCCGLIFGLVLGASLPGQGAYAQTASQITPSDLAPELRRLEGRIVFTGQAGTQAPAGSEQIGITLGGVTIEGALPQMAAANDRFVARLTGKQIPVSELFDATASLEEAYAGAGFVLARVVLPQQELADGGTLRVVVVDGFIEQIDVQNVPEPVRARIEGVTKPLVGKRGLTQAELERQLLLAGETPGTALKSAIGAGEAPGGTVIALEPEYRPITGFVGFGNPTSDALGSIALNFGVEFNSPLKFGETLYVRLAGAPEDMLSGDPRSRVAALGAVVPLGFSGLVLNAEVTASDTTPDDANAPTRSNFDRQSLRLSYPFIRTRSLTVDGAILFDAQQDNQSLVSGTTETPVYEDALAVLRLAGNITRTHADDAVSTGRFVLSRGLDAFGARTAADAAASGTPLSRDGADATFIKLALQFSHQRRLGDRVGLSINARAQSSFGDALVSSEQLSLVGPQDLSAFNSGSLRGDSGFLVRTELSTDASIKVGAIPVLLSPYVFAGFGVAVLENPTSVEQGRTEASSFGIGIDIFAQTQSNFRSSSVRIEVGRGKRNDGSADEDRFSISGTFRF